MALTASVKVTKSMQFKGGNRLWSNRYHFIGGTPADDTHWHTLFDAVTTAEKACTNSNITIVSATGYAAGSDVPVSTKVYSLAGTLVTVGGNTPASGETAALVRYTTSARTTKNHPIYCFNYYHGAVLHTSGTSADLLDLNMKTALTAYGTAWITGFSDGTITAKRSTPNAAAATGVATEEYVTHRDFPYTRSL